MEDLSKLCITFYLPIFKHLNSDTKSVKNFERLLGGLDFKQKMLYELHRPTVIGSNHSVYIKRLFGSTKTLSLIENS